MALISKPEIVSIAFNRAISDTKFSDSLIMAAELRYIKPILGKDLYDAIVLAPSDAQYITLLALIKQSLAHWVKYMALPEIYVIISDTGAHKVNASNAQQIDDQRFIELRDQVSDIAKVHSYAITEYLNKSTFSNYYSGKNPQNTVEISGGIIFDKGIEEDQEDDYGAKWNQGRGTKGQTY